MSGIRVLMPLVILVDDNAPSLSSLPRLNHWHLMQFHVTLLQDRGCWPLLSGRSDQWYARLMSAMEESYTVATRAHYVWRGTDNYDPESWIGVGPHEVSLGQVW